MDTRLILIMTLLIFSSSIVVFSQDNTRQAFSSEDINSVYSPSNKISREHIKIYSDKAIINKDNLIWARIEDTKSMEPTLNSNSITLEIKPDRFTDLSVGDIISYKHESSVIIHRIVNVDFDDSGWFVITKGDNNKNIDNYKVRFNDVKGVVVGIIY